VKNASFAWKNVKARGRHPEGTVDSQKEKYRKERRCRSVKDSKPGSSKPARKPVQARGGAEFRLNGERNMEQTKEGKREC